MPSRRTILVWGLPTLLAALLGAGYLLSSALRPARPPAPLGESMPRARYPLKIEAGKRYLMDQTGQPFLIHGEAAWSLIARLTREDAELYLEDRRRRGFNLVMVNLIEHKFADHPPDNAYGQAPFSRAGDFTSPNDAYFAHAEWVVEQASQRGMLVLLCPAYLGADGGEEGWYKEMLANGVSKLESYGRYVGGRFSRFDNLIWLEGGDFTPPAAHLELVDAVAEGIRSSDPRHLQAAHWSPETSGLDVAVSGWLDVNTTYSYEPVYLRSLVDYARPEQRPFFLVESGYEGEHVNTTRALRAEAYYALLSGASGEVFGSHWIWQFTPAPLWRRLLHRTWLTSLGGPGTLSMEHVRTLFASLKWWTLVPDSTYEVLVAGQGMKGRGAGVLEYAVLARDPQGSLAVAYIPTVREIRLDLARLRGPLRARWYDPSAGTFSAAAEAPLEARGEQSFRPPEANAAGDSDWLLVLDADEARSG